MKNKKVLCIRPTGLPIELIAGSTSSGIIPLLTDYKPTDSFIYTPYTLTPTKLVIRLPRKYKKFLKKTNNYNIQKIPRNYLSTINRYADKMINNKFYGKVLIKSEK